MGGYTRIYPSANPELQETYETLLKGANEVFQSSFQVCELCCFFLTTTHCVRYLLQPVEKTRE